MRSQFGTSAPRQRFLDATPEAAVATVIDPLSRRLDLRELPEQPLLLGGQVVGVQTTTG
jgi:hypothetical protein